MVSLKYIGIKIKCVKVNKQGDNIESLDCEVVESDAKPKGVLHWISDVDSVQCEVRIYDYLFKSENTAAIEEWLDDLNPNSLRVVNNSLIHNGLNSAAVEDKFQFERVGYFTVDNDSNQQRKVFNRTITLVETKKKKGN